MQPYFSNRSRRTKNQAAPRCNNVWRSALAGATLLVALSATPLRAMPQPGAPRLLRFSWRAAGDAAANRDDASEPAELDNAFVMESESENATDNQTLAPAVPLTNSSPPPGRASTRTPQNSNGNALPASGEMPIFPAPLPRSHSASAPQSRPREATMRAPQSRNDESNVVVPRKEDEKRRRSTFFGADAAILSAAEVPQTLSVGETFRLDVVAKNRGRSSWSSEDDALVRLVALWFHAPSGRRMGYRIRWVRGTIFSGRTARFDADLAAPARAGRYVLVLTMARLREGDYQPPRDFAALDEAARNGHFGARLFRVDVR